MLAKGENNLPAIANETDEQVSNKTVTIYGPFKNIERLQTDH